MGKIFISYRRSDSEAVTDRIYEHLASHFKGSIFLRPFREKILIFKDVDTIPRGVDYSSFIQDWIKSSDVVAAVIGKNWLSATDDTGSRRLDNPDDLVRKELETALAHDVPVIPILVGGALMPPKEELPASLQPLNGLHAIQVRRDPDFKNDIAQLRKDLWDYIKKKKELNHSRRSVKLQFILKPIILLGIVFGIWWFFYEPKGFKNTSNSNNTNVNSSNTAPNKTNEAEPEKVIPYDPDFLGGVRVPLPLVRDEGMAGQQLRGKVFDYTHYSLVMNESRGMPLYTACNIDRTSLKDIQQHPDVQWFYDRRIPIDMQTDWTFYGDKKWERGTQVWRRAVSWGSQEEAEAAARSVFFYSNAVPQYERFKAGIWMGLEIYVLRRLQETSTRLSVFTGPVYKDTDYEYREVKIPQAFWKIVAANDPTDTRKIFVYAYLIYQYNMSENGSGEIEGTGGGVSSFSSRFQVSVETIEQLTQLRFGVLKDYDTYSNQQ